MNFSKTGTKNFNLATSDLSQIYIYREREIERVTNRIFEVDSFEFYGV